MPRQNPDAPAVPVGTPLFRVVTTVTANQQLYEVVLDYLASAPIAANLAAQTAFLTAWRTNVQVPWLATLPSTVSITQFQVQEVAAGVIPTYQVAGLALAGTVVQPPLNGMLAAVLTKFTALKGQHGRGRAYVGPLPATFITPATDPNLLNAAGIAAFTTLGAAIQQAVVAAGVNWNLVVSTRPVAPIFTVQRVAGVSSMVPVATVGTVRRRKEGRGI